MSKYQQTERQKVNALLRKYGYEWHKSGGDPLHDVYEDLGVQETWTLYAPDQRVVTVNQALEELTRDGKISGWLPELEKEIEAARLARQAEAAPIQAPAARKTHFCHNGQHERCNGQDFYSGAPCSCECHKPTQPVSEPEQPTPEAEDSASTDAEQQAEFDEIGRQSRQLEEQVDGASQPSSWQERESRRLRAAAQAGENAFYLAQGRQITSAIIAGTNAAELAQEREIAQRAWGGKREGAGRKAQGTTYREGYEAGYQAGLRAAKQD